MLLQASGRTNGLRALVKAEQERGPDFLRLANALSALYPKESEEERLLDAMLTGGALWFTDEELTWSLTTTSSTGWWGEKWKLMTNESCGYHRAALHRRDCRCAIANAAWHSGVEGYWNSV